MAIIDSMTPKERRNPDLLKASRKRRIAAGSGTKPEDINKLLKMHRTMADVMKAMGGAKRGRWGSRQHARTRQRRHAGPEEMAKLAAQMPGGLPPGLRAAACLRPCPVSGQNCPAGFPDLAAFLPDSPARQEK